jgi:hypothetical protein
MRLIYKPLMRAKREGETLIYEHITESIITKNLKV